MEVSTQRRRVRQTAGRFGFLDYWIVFLFPRTIHGTDKLSANYWLPVFSLFWGGAPPLLFDDYTLDIPLHGLSTGSFDACMQNADLIIRLYICRRRVILVHRLSGEDACWRSGFSLWPSKTAGVQLGSPHYVSFR